MLQCNYLKGPLPASFCIVVRLSLSHLLDLGTSGVQNVPWKTLYKPGSCVWKA